MSTIFLYIRPRAIRRLVSSVGFRVYVAEFLKPIALSYTSILTLRHFIGLPVHSISLASIVQVRYRAANISTPFVLTHLLEILIFQHQKILRNPKNHLCPNGSAIATLAHHNKYYQVIPSCFLGCVSITVILVTSYTFMYCYGDHYLSTFVRNVDRLPFPQTWKNPRMSQIRPSSI